YNQRDTRAVWRSIRPHGGITAGTLYHEAKQHGWVNRADSSLDPDELRVRKRIAAERVAQEEAEIARERAETREKAKAIWKAALPASAAHPYLQRKGVASVATLRQIDAAQAAG